MNRSNRKKINFKLIQLKQPSASMGHCSIIFISVFSFLAFFAHIGNAQLDNRPLEQRFRIDSSLNRRLAVRFSSLGFVKNNEYFNAIAEGYTLFGYQLNPRLAYQPAPHIVLEGGVFFANDFGQQRIMTIAPTFTIKVQQRSWYFLFGTLEGAVGHRLIEPLYNFERLLGPRIENGLQINHVSDRTFFDFWISYPQNTRPGYTRQEHFWGGLSFESIVNRRAFRPQQPGLRLSVPVQLTVFHAGGQNIVSSLPVRTALNAAGSLSVTWQNRAGAFLRSIRLDTYGIAYSENADHKASGGAFYPNLTLSTRPLTILMSYWHGNYYRAEYGGDLYQSYARRFVASPVAMPYEELHRRLLLVRFLKTIRLTDEFSVVARFEPHYDVNNKRFEHSEGLYFQFNH